MVPRKETVMSGGLINDGQWAFSRVLWIGGATDSGKTTTAHILAGRHGLPIYHYDKHDIAHHEKLAKTYPAYRDFLTASLDDRWVFPEPDELFRRSLQSFRDRFPLLLEDLVSLPLERGIIVEGFGLLPELLAPILCHSCQALWLIPTESFKLDSMTRRGKPSFGSQVSDLERAKNNLFIRDMLLAEYIKSQVLQYGYTLYEVDGTHTADEMADWMEGHYAPYLATFIEHRSQGQNKHIQ
jgi:hypothetical protein